MEERNNDQGRSKIKKWADGLRQKLPSHRLISKDENQARTHMYKSESFDDNDYYYNMYEKEPLFTAKTQDSSNFASLNHKDEVYCMMKEDDFSTTIDTVTSSTNNSENSPSTPLRSAAVLRRLRRRPSIDVDFLEESQGILRLEADTLEIAENVFRIYQPDSEVVCQPNSEAGNQPDSKAVNQPDSEKCEIVESDVVPVVFYSGTSLHDDTIRSTDILFKNHDVPLGSYSDSNIVTGCTSDDDDVDAVHQSDPIYAQLDVPAMVKMHVQDSLDKSTHSHRTQTKGIIDSLDQSTHSRRSQRKCKVDSLDKSTHSQGSQGSSRRRESNSSIRKVRQVFTKFPTTRRKDRRMQALSMKVLFDNSFQPVTPKNIDAPISKNVYNQKIHDGTRSMKTETQQFPTNECNHSKSIQNLQAPTASFQKMAIYTKEDMTSKATIGHNAPPRINKHVSPLEARSGKPTSGKSPNAPSHRIMNDDRSTMLQRDYEDNCSSACDTNVMKCLIAKAMNCGPVVPTSLFQQAVSHHGKGLRPSRTKRHAKKMMSLNVFDTGPEDNYSSLNSVITQSETPPIQVSTTTLSTCRRRDPLAGSGSSDTSTLPDADGQKRKGQSPSKMIPDMAWIRQSSTDASDHNLTISNIRKHDVDDRLRPVKSYDDRIDTLWEQQQERKRHDISNPSLIKSPTGNNVCITKEDNGWLSPQEEFESCIDPNDVDMDEETVNSYSQGQAVRFTLRSTAASFGQSVRSGQLGYNYDMNYSLHSKTSISSSLHSDSANMSRSYHRRRPTTSAFLKRQSVFKGQNLLESRAAALTDSLEGKRTNYNQYDQTDSNKQSLPVVTSYRRFDKDITATNSSTTIKTSTCSQAAVTMAKERLVNAMSTSYDDETVHSKKSMMIDLGCNAVLLSKFTKSNYNEKNYNINNSNINNNNNKPRDCLRNKHMSSVRRRQVQVLQNTQTHTTTTTTSPITPCEFPMEIIFDTSSHEQQQHLANDGISSLENST